MAEFALVLPILLAVLFGIVEFGIAFNRAQAVEAAAREGARLASISTTTDADVEARVTDTLAGMPLDGVPMVSVSPAPCLGRPGEEVTVEVTVAQNVEIPLVNSWLIFLNGEAVFRCEA